MKISKSELEKLRPISPISYRKLFLPTALAALLILGIFLLNALLSGQSFESEPIILLLLGLGGSIRGIFVFYTFTSSRKRSNLSLWVNATIAGIGLGVIAAVLPERLYFSVYILVVLNIISVALTAGRNPSYLIILLSSSIQLTSHVSHLDSYLDWLQNLGLPLLAIIITETILRLQNTIRYHIKRLETINKFTRQIASSIETKQVISLLNAAIQTALEADTYFIGLLDGDRLDLGLFYDDGEYFSNVKIPLDGTLGGWVVKNQKSLFIPDLRQGIHLEDVDVQHIVGKNKASLSWIGVPMQTEHITGVIALASYHPNAFDRTTMELLENLTQHAALALNNAYHHEEVEEQSHIDSLTGAYNHGHFLKMLERHAEDAQINNNRLSLIMLDVDYFKQYNDAYGHLAGDEILTLLVKTIRRYIKRTDTVGRWGGEEFAIALPNTNGLQATLVAERVRETMTRLTITAREKENIPVPTVSQGIAVFPDEADKIFTLIDLADQRLYVAKERGRNQIEPSKSHWRRLKTDH